MLERQEIFRILLGKFDDVHPGLVDIEEAAAAPFDRYKALDKQAEDEFRAALPRFRLLM